jgi:hypothetical protein
MSGCTCLVEILAAPVFSLTRVQAPFPALTPPSGQVEPRAAHLAPDPRALKELGCEGN